MFVLLAGLWGRGDGFVYVRWWRLVLEAMQRDVVGRRVTLGEIGEGGGLIRHGWRIYTCDEIFNVVSQWRCCRWDGGSHSGVVGRCTVDEFENVAIHLNLANMSTQV